MKYSVEEMKGNIKNRIAIGAVMTGVICLLVASQVLNMFHPFIGGENYADFLAGIQLGLMIAVELVCIYYLGSYISVLKDEKLLRQLYIKENDERTLLIEQKAGINSYKYIVIGLVVAAVIAGYFSIGAFVALLGAVIYEVAVRGALYIYYSKRI